MKGPKNKKEGRLAGFSLPGVSVEQLETMLDFMAVHGLEKFEYEHAGTHIRLKRAETGGNKAGGAGAKKPARRPAEEAAAANAEAARASAAGAPPPRSCTSSSRR